MPSPSLPLEPVCLFQTIQPKQRYDYRQVAVNKFLRLGEIQFGNASTATTAATTTTPTARPWEIAQRTTRTIPLDAYRVSPAPLPVDSVDIRALVTRRQPNSDPAVFMVVVAQYRPPLDAICLEFPAGLLDAGESPTAAALRELKEETGLVVPLASQALAVTVAEDLTAYEPGMSDSCFYFVTIQVDGDLPENQKVEPEPDDGEEIDVWLVPHDGTMLKSLQGLMKDRYNGQRCTVDGKLYAYALAKHLQ